jgi:mycothiol system anti-sigma-R factor
MHCEEARDLLETYLDGELDDTRAQMLEAHLQACADCARQHAQALALRGSIQQAPRYAAPEALRNKVLASLANAQPRRRPRAWAPRGWLQFGGAIAATVLLTSILTYTTLAPSRRDALANDVVDTHVRGLITSHLTDVESSDRHTVRPWFNGKLDFSPPVVDLEARGFPLVGGRLDYMDGRPVAALVYRRRQHWISVFIWRDGQSRYASASTAATRGYNVTQWSAQGLRWCVVSDIASEEQQALAALLRDSGQPQ